ncbi:hypothetical protein [Lysobacter sp. A03]|uniref:hypothetical protein n=1 Tax=Lysobacter sp. A03 TaxID=1199154 RepID=UPI0005B6D0E4|nr:hypothetical protein [Lysobacter sp. A03]KIQ98145.1 hypothetical protein TI01_0331 [Lysobacter sp. A03]
MTIQKLARLSLFASLVLAVGGCSGPKDGTDGEVEAQAGQPINPVTLAARLLAIPVATALGDSATADGQFQAAHSDVMRSMKVADSRRPIDREAARAAAGQVAGVRTVVWIDRHHLLALVNGGGYRSQQTISGICQQLEPLGDTLAVVVHLQDATARTGDELETISRNCQLKPGELALAQSRRDLDVIDPAIRARHKMLNATEDDPAESKRRADEAMRLIEASTPEM